MMFKISAAPFNRRILFSVVFFTLCPILPRSPQGIMQRLFGYDGKLMEKVDRVSHRRPYYSVCFGDKGTYVPLDKVAYTTV